MENKESNDGGHIRMFDCLQNVLAKNLKNGVFLRQITIQPTRLVMTVKVSTADMCDYKFGRGSLHF